MENFVGKWQVKYMEVLDDNGQGEKITLEQFKELKDEFPAEDYSSLLETFKFIIDIQNGLIRIMHPKPEEMSLEDFIAQNKAQNVLMIDNMTVLQESKLMPNGAKLSFYGFMNQPMVAELVDDMLYIEAMGMYLEKYVG